MIPHLFKISIIILISIIFSFFKYNYQENFITWFTPFYNKGTVELTAGTPKYMTSNLEYNYLEYDYDQELRFYTLKKSSKAALDSYYKFIFSNITKSTKVKKVLIFQEESNTNLLKKVNEDKKNLAIISAPQMVDKMSSNLPLIQNINFVIVCSYRFIFFIANKQSQISKLIEINNKKINIGLKDSDDYIFGNNIVSNLKINNDLNIQPFYLNPIDSFKQLINGDIDGMFFTDLYPSTVLGGFIEQDLEKKLVIIPIDGINQEVFRLQNIFVEPVAIDLNALPENYLPVKVKELEYTIYRPNLKTFRYPDFIVCNKNAEPRLSFNIANSFVSNLDIVNSSQFFLKNGYNYLAFPSIGNSMYFPTHIGAKIFYNKITINTTMPDEKCKYFVGNAKCTPERIEGSRIVTGLDDDD